MDLDNSLHHYTVQIEHPMNFCLLTGQVSVALVLSPVTYILLFGGLTKDSILVIFQN